MPTERTTRRVQIERSPEDRAREEAIRQEFQHRPKFEELMASGQYEGPVRHGDLLAFLAAMGELKRHREALGLSLADVAERSGIDKAALSRLENGHLVNPTLATLMKYAKALGKRIEWQFSDAGSSPSE